MSLLEHPDPAALRPQPRRDGVDLWHTPPDLVAALDRHVLRPLTGSSRQLWEPAAGDGHIAMPLRKAGYEVIASDIVPRAPDVLRCDFLHQDPPEDIGGHTVMVTNPPFREPLFDQFIRRSAELTRVPRLRLHAAILLVRIDHLTASGRAAFFDRAWRIHICCWRPRWIPGSKGNGRWAFAWVTWKRGYSGPPKTQFLVPGDLDEPRLL